jgi:KaiC/GvpD/RAD55 family RecA-like ATPase
MKIACAGNAVVVLSGEGAGLGRRAEAWMQQHGQGQELEDLQLLALESVANLNAEEEMAGLQQAIEEAGIRPALVIIDTFSKFSAGLDENSNQEVAEYLSKLTVGVRERYCSTVLLVAHSGHGDAKRFKDTASMQPLAFEAVEVDLGRVDKYGEAVKSLVMRETNAPTKAAAVHSPQGKAQRTILFALRERQKKSETPLVWTVEEIRQIGRECGVPRQSVHDAVEKLMLSPFLKATVGGSMLGEP